MTICKEINCKKQACYGLIGDIPQFCKEHKSDDMDDVRNKKCVKCKKTRPNYGLEQGKATHCYNCKTDIMYDVITKKCIKCNIKNVRFGLEGGKATHCKDCKTLEMINVKDIYKKCVKCNIKIASFGLERDKATHCIDCKDDNMFDVKNKKCIKCNIKQPSFGLNGQSPTHCKDCKTTEMSNIKSKKKCIKCNLKYPAFGLERGHPTHCADCKTSEMFDVVNIKCIKCNLKYPSFGLEGNKATYCKDCKTPEMININAQKCIDCNIKQATFGLENMKPTHCSDCKTSKMFDVINKLCKTENCSTRANSNYEGYCAYCYGNLHPDSPIVRNFKTKERLVVDYIRIQYPDLSWKFDKIIENGCSKRRPDIYLDLGYQVIIVEVDENQHQSYDCSCENKRLMELSQDINHRPLIFIRFNPDKYFDQDNKNIPSCFSITKKTGALKVNNNKKWNERLSNLKTQIDYWNKNETDKTIEIIQLYYDEN